MRSAALSFTVLLLSLTAASAARAQANAAPDGAPPRLTKPTIEAPSAESIVPAPQAEIATLPPEPELPKWGYYTQPESTPFALPPTGYDLVGPPLGVVQPDVSPVYSPVIGDPGVVPAFDEGITRTIDLARPDGLAPVGVRGDHTLRTGHALFSIRYDQSTYDTIFHANHRVSTTSVLANSAFAPQRMLQSRVTALLEYGVTDDLTLMFTLPYENSRLNYVDGGGNPFSTAFSNPGDLKLTGLLVLLREPGEQLHLNLGMSFPTGFLDSQLLEPSPVLPNLPYVIRTSSGSFDLLPGLTYRGQNENWSWGSQATGVVHLGRNRAGYELGDQVDLTSWISARWTQRWGTSLRIDAQGWGNVRGADPRLDPTLAPTNRPDMQGAIRVNMLMGINYFVPAHRIPGQVFSFEAGAPVFQTVEGDQLGLDWMLVAGWNILL